MNEIVIALIIGIVAGGIDVIPMLRRKINVYSTASVFAQWVLLGLVIPFVEWGIQPWLKGLILGLLGMSPTAIQVFFRNRQAFVPTLVYGAVLGMVVAVAGKRLIG